MEAKDRIIVALDVNSLDEAICLVDTLHLHVGFFKIGLELISSVGGAQVISAIQTRGGKVFYDGKFCDIPNTVGKASRVVSGFGAKMFNVHASAGRKAMEAAVENRGDSLVLAVTVLTSLQDDDIGRIFYFDKRATVLNLAHEAKQAKVNGLICSPKDLEYLCETADFDNLLKVTPGIRPRWAAKNDQARITTPADAIELGADYLVIGRPITSPPSTIGTPVEAVKKIIQEINSVK